MKIEKKSIQVKPVDEYRKTLSDYEKRKFNLVLLDFTFINDEQDIFESFLSQLKFPSYFGKNWDALWDCITDLMWLDNKDTAILITNFRLFKNEKLRKLLIDQLEDAKEFWSKHNVVFDTVMF